MKRRIISLFLIIVFLSNSTSIASNLETQKEETTEEISELSQIESEILAELGDTQKKIYDQSKEIEAIEDEIEATEIELEVRTKSIETLEKKIEKQKQLLAARIKFNYEQTRGNNVLWYLLSSKNFTDYINKAEYDSAVAKYDINLISSFEDTVSQRNKEKKELDKLSKSAKEKKAAINNQIDSLLSVVSENEKKYLQTKAERQKKEDELSNIIEKMLMYERLAGYADDNMSKEKLDAIIAAGGNFNQLVNARDGEETLLAAIIYCEAGGEPYEGQLAVGSVVLNRVNSPKFPSSITEVIYSPRQFTPAGSGRLAVVLANNLTNDSSRLAARQVLSQGSVGSWLYFRVNDGSRQGQVIGRQVFY